MVTWAWKLNALFCFGPIEKRDNLPLKSCGSVHFIVVYRLVRSVPVKMCVLNSCFFAIECHMLPSMFCFSQYLLQLLNSFIECFPSFTRLICNYAFRPFIHIFVDSHASLPNNTWTSKLFFNLSTRKTTFSKKHARVLSHWLSKPLVCVRAKIYFSVIFRISVSF